MHKIEVFWDAALCCEPATNPGTATFSTGKPYSHVIKHACITTLKLNKVKYYPPLHEGI